ncbi:MAG: hypothetical protein ACOH1Y_11470 [Propionicimonas sp.]
MTTTDEDVQERMFMRDQAERFGLDPDTHAGPILFSDAEWAEMTATHESRVDFGLELPCGCLPGSCSSQYGGDCWRNDPEAVSAYEMALTAKATPTAWVPVVPEDNCPF